MYWMDLLKINKQGGGLKILISGGGDAYSGLESIMTVLSVTVKNNLGNSYLDYDEKTTDLFTSMSYSNFKTLYDNLIEIGARTMVK